MIYISLIFLTIVFAMYIYLSFRIISLRGKTKTRLGEGKDKTLLYHIRAQANLFEYSVIFFAFLLIAELNKLDYVWMGVISALFLIGRLSHMYGFVSGKDGMYRTRGMQFTIWALFFMVFYNLYYLIF